MELELVKITDPDSEYPRWFLPCCGGSLWAADVETARRHILHEEKCSKSQKFIEERDHYFPEAESVLDKMLAEPASLPSKPALPLHYQIQAGETEPDAALRVRDEYNRFRIFDLSEMD